MTYLLQEAVSLKHTNKPLIIFLTIFQCFLASGKFVKSIYFIIFTILGVKPRFLTRFFHTNPILCSHHQSNIWSSKIVYCKSKYSLHVIMKPLKCMLKRVSNKNYVISLFHNGHWNPIWLSSVFKKQDLLISRVCS